MSGYVMAKATRVRVKVKPTLLRWARERAGLQFDEIARRFPRLARWGSGEVRPTRKQLERFAKATHAAVDHLLLTKPPVERVPIPDFRAPGNARIGQPSPNLLDTLSLCQQRQAWYREFARAQGDKPLAFVGSVKLTSDIATTAAAMQSALGLDLEERRKIPAWDKTLRRLSDAADALGILVMVNGVVGNNSYRRLDPQEFRGFALADARAPLVFINGADAKAAQMFTLAHALAHVWLGQSALSDVTPVTASEHDVERWCSAVGAEVPVPLDALRAEYRRGEELRNALTRHARRFKVSTPVILRRIHDLGGLAHNELREAYERELERLRPQRKSSGGDFYRTQGVRLGRRFARALVLSTLESNTEHGDAFRLLGFSKLATLRELGHRLGVV
jgi:Zn-dependent peptidase ImmA (M78 family)/transcriptional regulator with XRE-family HTH domain